MAPTTCSKQPPSKPRCQECPKHQPHRDIELSANSATMDSSQSAQIQNESPVQMSECVSRIDKGSGSVSVPELKAKGHMQTSKGSTGAKDKAQLPVNPSTSSEGLGVALTSPDVNPLQSPGALHVPCLDDDDTATPTQSRVSAGTKVTNNMNTPVPSKAFYGNTTGSSMQGHSGATSRPVFNLVTQRGLMRRSSQVCSSLLTNLSVFICYLCRVLLGGCLPLVKQK